MTRRPPAQPPELDGLTLLRRIGGGGFADVFLYEQQLPHRRVAVKVLDPRDDDPHALEQEVNAMAALEAERSIVSIYEVRRSSDGRSCLLMEYCPNGSLDERLRAGHRYREVETLEIGVRLAGAIANAHHVGVMHRDIKPANILFAENGRPKLTDFGIAASSGSTTAGFSVPWAPPEALDPGARTEETADVYSLAATLYAMLAGHAPFALPGQPTNRSAHAERIRHMPVPPLGRDDVSPELVTTLERALAKNPADRPQSAQAFMRELQRVQIRLRMNPTPVELLDGGVTVPEPEDWSDAERTRLRRTGSDVPSGTGVITGLGDDRSRSIALDPLTAGGGPAPAQPVPQPVTPTATGSGVPSPGSMRPPTGMSATSGMPTAGPAWAPPMGTTGTTAIPPTDVPATPPARTHRRRSTSRFIISIVVGSLVGVAAVIGIRLWQQNTTTAIAARPAASAQSSTRTVPQVTDLRSNASGSNVVFTWSNPDPRDGDTYLYRIDDSGSSGQFIATVTPRVSVPASATGRTCVTIKLIRADNRAGDPVQACNR